jgi:putative ABC transport system permease protein
MKKFSVLMKIAFRNVFRHLKRNLVISVLIFFSSYCMVTFFSFQQESYKNISNSMIDVLMGHIVVMSGDSKASSYLSDNRDWENLKPINESKQKIDSVLDTIPGISDYSNRTRFEGLLQKGSKQIPSFIIGITPGQEYKVTKSLMVEQGKKLSDASVDGIMLTKGLAEKLNAKIGQKVTLMTDTSNGGVSQKKLTLEGIVTLQGLDKYEIDFAYIHNDTAGALLNYSKNSVSEYVIRISDPGKVDSLKNTIAAKFNQNGIRAKAYTWYDLGGLPTAVIDITKDILIATLVIAFAVIFLFIANTILTLVFKRKKEIGTLRAIGMHRKDVVISFLTEIEIINAIFSLLGIILGCITVVGLGQTSGAPHVSDVMEYVFGGKSMHPVIVWYNPVITFLSFSVVTLLAAILPALKASRLQPIDAIERQ